MNAITSFIKRHPQVTFWSIAITTFFVSAFLSDVGLWGLLIYGTFLGAVLVTGVVDGRRGLKIYFGRIVRWRVGLKWYAVALFLPLVLNLVAFGINIASGAALPTTPQWPAWTVILGAFFWPGLLAIALTEEPSFTGFALPRFMAVRSVLAATLIVGALRTLWHLPFFIAFLSEGNFAGILNQILMVMSGAVFFTWLFNKTNGSVLIPMLLHASLDVISGDGRPLTLGPLFSGFSQAELVRQDIIQGLVFVAAAVLIIVLTKFALGRKPEAAKDAMVAEQPLVAGLSRP
jgi:membrane protease YdiL (CAAX protease family)